MTIDEMRARKRELGYTNEFIAERSGVPLSTVQKIFSGATSSPRKSTIQALTRLLWPRFSYEQATRMPDASLRAGSVAYDLRGAASQATDGSYTIADYMALPDEQRVELIDGVFYEMAGPHALHQALVGFLHNKLYDHVLAHRGPCIPLLSPFDVQLDCDDRTMVQPDVIVLCDQDKLDRKKGRIFGAPDLVIEVLSPSTRKKDMQLKLQKYGHAGVREYWMIDADERKVIQHDLEHLGIPAIYGFDDEIPVLIWDGQCRIRIEELMEHFPFLFDDENEDQS